MLQPLGSAPFESLLKGCDRLSQSLLEGPGVGVLEHEVEHIEDTIALMRGDGVEEFEAVEHGLISQGRGRLADEVVEGDVEGAGDDVGHVDGRGALAAFVAGVHAVGDAGAAGEFGAGELALGAERTPTPYAPPPPPPPSAARP